MLLGPTVVVVSMEEINKLVFKFMLLELLPLGIHKIYVCRIENNDVNQKKPPHKLPVLPPRLPLNHPLTLSLYFSNMGFTSFARILFVTLIDSLYKLFFWWVLFQFSSVAQSCPNLCDPMNCSMPGLPVHHQLPEFTQTHIHHPSSQ